MEYKKAIFTVCNDEDFEYCNTMLKTFFMSNSKFSGDFFVLYKSLKKKNMKELSKYGVILFKVDTSLYKSSGIPESFLKLEMLKFDSYNKMLFIDSHSIILDDITYIFNYDCPFASVSDECKINIITRRKRQHIDSGFYYFGNKTYIGEDTYNDMISYYMKVETHKNIFTYNISKNIKIKWCEDSELLNVYFLDKEMYLLPYTYFSYFGINTPNKNLITFDWRKTCEKIINYKVDVFDETYKFYPCIIMWRYYNNLNI